jgi:hypothetical protein
MLAVTLPHPFRDCSQPTDRTTDRPTDTKTTASGTRTAPTWRATSPPSTPSASTTARCRPPSCPAARRRWRRGCTASRWSRWTAPPSPTWAASGVCLYRFSPLWILWLQPYYVLAAQHPQPPPATSTHQPRTLTHRPIILEPIRPPASGLTALSTLRLMPRDHGLGGLGFLLPLRLKQLKLRWVPAPRPALHPSTLPHAALAHHPSPAATNPADRTEPSPASPYTRLTSPYLPIKSPRPPFQAAARPAAGLADPRPADQHLRPHPHGAPGRRRAAGARPPGRGARERGGARG